MRGLRHLNYSFSATLFFRIIAPTEGFKTSDHLLSRKQTESQNVIAPSWGDEKLKQSINAASCFGCLDGLITVTDPGLIVIKYPANQFHFTWSCEAWSADTSRIPCFVVRLKNIILDLKCWNSYRDNVQLFNHHFLGLIKWSFGGIYNKVYSILDIDLDYFNLLPEPGVSLEHLLNWAGLPVSMIVERHNHAFARWKTKLRTHGIVPTHILHVDEHHDMMDQRPQTNIANFMFHAMRIWSQCRVHWLVQYPIDSPAMWLDDDTWDLFRRRFTHGTHRPARWPKPDLVSVCTSPDFVTPAVTQELLKVLSCFTTKTQRGRCSIG